MLVPNTDIWATRIQNIGALLTASAKGRDEVYYLATACQVGISPPLISISPNPEYPICDVIAAAGYFGLNFLAEHQEDVVTGCITLDRFEPGKLALLGLRHERTEHQTPLLLDCLQAIECRVESSMDTGDHRCFIATVTERRVREAYSNSPPQRFGGTTPLWRRWAKAVVYGTRLYDLAYRTTRGFRATVGIEAGTRCQLSQATAATPPAQEQRTGALGETLSASNIRRGGPVPGMCLVGCGWWGSVHAFELKRLGPGVRRYFASRDAARAGDFARRFDGEDAFCGLDEALRDPRVDAVVLALPHHLHAEAARSALAAGKHVLVEKPLALTVEDGKDLVRMADASRLCLALAEQYRLSPLVRKAREVMDQGLLGRVVMVHAGMASPFQPPQQWQNLRATMGGGVLLDVGIHYINVLRHWFGEPESLWAVAPRHLNERFEGEDSALVVLRFPGPLAAELSVSWSASRSPEAPNFEILGEKGALELWFGRPYLRFTAPLPSEHWSRRLQRILPWRVYERIRKWLPRTQQRHFHVGGADLIGSRAIIEDFLLAITGQRACATPGTEGLRDLSTVLAAYRSVATGGPVVPAELLSDPW